MNLDARTVDRYGFDLDADELLLLHLLKQAFEYAGLGPTIQPGIDRVPVAKTCR